MKGERVDMYERDCMFTMFIVLNGISIYRAFSFAEEIRRHAGMIQLSNRLLENQDDLNSVLRRHGDPSGTPDLVHKPKVMHASRVLAVIIMSSWCAL